MDTTAKNIQDVLQMSLKQEIGAMREMLSNMHQEELSLLARDRMAWTQVMTDRVCLLSRLSELRSTRLKAAKELEHLAQAGELDCETLSMGDQLASLVEKMNQQQRRIQNLENASSSCPSRYPPTQPKEPAKKSGAIATYPKET